MGLDLRRSLRLRVLLVLIVVTYVVVALVLLRIDPGPPCWESNAGGISCLDVRES